MENIDCTTSATQIIHKKLLKNKIDQVVLNSPLFEYMECQNYTFTDDFITYKHVPNVPEHHIADNTASSSSLYWHNDEYVEFSIHVGNLEAYKAGMVHINYIVDKTPEFPWSRSNGNSHKYKSLKYEDDAMLFLELFDTNLDDSFPIHAFVLGSENLPDIKHEYSLDNEQLLQRYAFYYRKHRIGNVINEL